MEKNKDPWDLRCSGMRTRRTLVVRYRSFADKIGATVFTKRRYLTTNISCVTSQKSEDLIYTTAESWIHAQKRSLKGITYRRLSGVFDSEFPPRLLVSTADRRSLTKTLLKLCLYTVRYKVGSPLIWRRVTARYYSCKVTALCYTIRHRLPCYTINSVALVRERTIPTERPPPVGEVSANFCG